ncbi:MAG: hemerythrin domain-containing protein [Caulobacteraceae bacterium]|nr:hemerythrin domain-containing protein [Caulobacteraceae bacterium]
MDVTAYRDEHHRIMKRAAELLSACERIDGSAALDEAKKAVKRLDGVLRVHLQREDDELYGWLADSEDAEVRATAAQAMEDMGGLAQAWAGFVDQCAKAEFPQDIPRLSSTCHTLLSALTHRVRWENEVLYPMAEALRDKPSGN